jgi:hypothetical protein
MLVLQPTYRSYLIRFRLADNGGQPTWHVTLQEPGTREERPFESLAALHAYLEDAVWLGNSRATNETPDGR